MVQSFVRAGLRQMHVDVLAGRSWLGGPDKENQAGSPFPCVSARLFHPVTVVDLQVCLACAFLQVCYLTTEEHSVASPWQRTNPVQPRRSQGYRTTVWGSTQSHVEPRLAPQPWKQLYPYHHQTPPSLKALSRAGRSSARSPTEQSGPLQPL